MVRLCLFDCLRSPAISGNPNLSMSLYRTNHGVFCVTWTRNFFGHSLNLFLHSQDHYLNPSFASLPSLPTVALSELSLSSAVSFRLHVNPLAFWRKRGSRLVCQKIRVVWDLSGVKFESSPEPTSGFYIAVIVDGEMGLLIGDAINKAYTRTRARRPMIPQALVLRREHVFGNRVFCTRARIGGRSREISIDCGKDEDEKLCFDVDNERVLEIKRLRWKFRGNAKIEVDGVHVHISWDVYNWLFENEIDVDGDDGEGHAVFMFRFGSGTEEVVCETAPYLPFRKKKTEEGKDGDVLDWRKMRRSLMMSKRTMSLSSSSMSMSFSSSSSACSSSVLEWASSADEAECGGFSAGGGGLGFSLLVYAWRK